MINTKFFCQLTRVSGDCECYCYCRKLKEGGRVSYCLLLSLALNVIYCSYPYLLHGIVDSLKSSNKICFFRDVGN